MKRRSIACILFLLSLLAANVSRCADSNLIHLRIDPEYFSPGRDGISDQTFVYPVLRSNVDVTRWELDISRANGKVVQRLSGAGFPALAKWDGKDRRGVQLPDGDYRATFSIWSADGKASADAHLAIDTRSPEVSLSVSTPVIDTSFFEGNTLRFRPSVKDASPLDRWQIQVLDETGRTVRVFWSTGAAHELPWDGTDFATGVLVAPGSYKGVFEAWDRAGNGSDPAFVDLSVSVTPREMLEHVLNLIQAKHLPEGLVVQLNAADLFESKKNSVEVSPKGRMYLREAAILVNTYPDASIRVEGYRPTEGKKDRQLSGIYAWRVYTDLVKKGHVVPSRLIVRGRGHTPTAERRAMKLPIISDGVEITLEGVRD